MIEAEATVADRLAELADEELRLLAVGVGEHLPVELADRIVTLRFERQRPLTSRRGRGALRACPDS
jgi:hypothetical protein